MGKGNFCVLPVRFLQEDSTERSTGMKFSEEYNVCHSEEYGKMGLCSNPNCCARDGEMKY